MAEQAASAGDADDAPRELRIHASLHPAATLAAADATAPSAPAALAVLALRALVAHAEPGELPALVGHPLVADTAQQHGVRATDGLRVYDVNSAVEAHAAGDKWGRNALYIFRMQNIGCMSEGTTWTDNGTWLRRTEPHGMVSADEAYALWRRDCSTMNRRQLRLHVDMPIRRGPSLRAKPPHLSLLPPALSHRACASAGSSCARRSRVCASNSSTTSALGPTSKRS